MPDPALQQLREELRAEEEELGEPEVSGAADIDYEEEEVELEDGVEMPRASQPASSRRTPSRPDQRELSHDEKSAVIYRSDLDRQVGESLEKVQRLTAEAEGALAVFLQLDEQLEQETANYEELEKQLRQMEEKKAERLAQIVARRAGNAPPSPAEEPSPPLPDEEPDDGSEPEPEVPKTPPPAEEPEEVAGIVQFGRWLKKLVVDPE